MSYKFPEAFDHAYNEWGEDVGGPNDTYAPTAEALRPHPSYKAGWLDCAKHYGITDEDVQPREPDMGRPSDADEVLQTARLLEMAYSTIRSLAHEDWLKEIRQVLVERFPATWQADPESPANMAEQLARIEALERTDAATEIWSTEVHRLVNHNRDHINKLKQRFVEHDSIENEDALLENIFGSPEEHLQERIDSGITTLASRIERLKKRIEALEKQQDGRKDGANETV